VHQVNGNDGSTGKRFPLRRGLHTIVVTIAVGTGTDCCHLSQHRDTDYVCPLLT
jgi:hypothetical protein